MALVGDKIQIRTIYHLRIFSETFYGIENIEQKITLCISYLFNMQLLDKSLKTKYGESTELTPQSRLYLTPRGEIMWEMLSWDSVLLEIFREDYYREYSNSSTILCCTPIIISKS